MPPPEVVLSKTQKRGGGIIQMDNDDLPVGRIMTRREVIALMGLTGATLAIGRTLGQVETGGSSEFPSCVVRPEQMEGPYYTDERLERSDIRVEPSTGEVKEGIPLALTFRVFQIGNSCTPLEGATVDIWNCDAQGDYSAFEDTRQGFDNVGQIWLRGYQVTDENGEVQFLTIYPGWYPGRAVHIHFKIQTTTPATGSYEFASQLYFNDDLSDQVFQQEPYIRDEARETRNANDFLFQNGGQQLLLDLTRTSEGFAATFDIGLDLS